MTVKRGFEGLKNFSLYSPYPELILKHTAANSANEALELFHIDPDQVRVIEMSDQKVKFKHGHDKCNYTLTDHGYA